MLEEQQKEKRRFPRLSVDAPLRFQCRGFPEYHNAACENISLGGLAFTSLDFFCPNSLVALEIKLLSKVLNPVGRIAWSFPLPHSNRHKIGVEFLEVNPSEKNFLSDYIDMHLNEYI